MKCARPGTIDKITPQKALPDIILKKAGTFGLAIASGKMLCRRNHRKIERSGPFHRAIRGG
jgi:hypothetical protein